MPTLRLILLRHAEAEGESLGIDHARKLTSAGWKEAREVGVRLAASGWLPARGYVSDAMRAQETRVAVSEHLPQTYWTASPAFYLAPADVMARALKGPLPDGAGDATPDVCRIVLAHNPGLSDLAHKLSGAPVRLGTAEAALLSIEASSWSEALEMTGVWQLVEQLGGR